jgi:hypothetical protein
MSEQTQHTPVPWRVTLCGPNDQSIEIQHEYTEADDPDDIAPRIAEIEPEWTLGGFEQAKANGAFMVRACNSFEDLLAACELLVAIETSKSTKRLGRSDKCTYCGATGDHYTNSKCPVLLARAALAKARGEAVTT